MSCFDTLIVMCPRCDNKVEFQSKSGPCNMDRYNTRNCPSVIMVDVEGDTVECEVCKTVVTIVLTNKPRIRAEIFVPEDEDND